MFRNSQVVTPNFKSSLFWHQILKDYTIHPVRNNFQAISHCQILPPKWASLGSDLPIYNCQEPLPDVPPLIALDCHSSCPCGSICSMYNPSKETIEDDCTIYTLTSGKTTCIQLQLECCPTCRQQRFIGPDPWDLGLFNFNNCALFMYNLLDDYTSSYTSSDTPFVAWVAVIARCYNTFRSLKPFVPEQDFHAAWFSYVNLQQLKGDMQCPKCRPTPNNMMWDSVILTFGQKHLLPSLWTPAASHKDSLKRKCKDVGKQQIVPNSALQKVIKKLIKGPFLINKETEGNNVEEFIDHLRAIPDVRKQLLKHSK